MRYTVRAASSAAGDDEAVPQGTKCFTEKCPSSGVRIRPVSLDRTGTPAQGSEYSKQLREKQKIKRIYGLSEQQFRNTFTKVTTLPGITGHNLLAALESRLDNMVYRMGFAASRKAARQLIRHRHVDVNHRLVDVPSYQVTPGEEVRVRQHAREFVAVRVALEQASRGANAVVARCRSRIGEREDARATTRAAIPIAAQEQLSSS